MPSIYDIQQNMKALFRNYGYTIYDLSTFDNQKITKLGDEYPILCIGRGNEITENDGSPTDFLIQDSEVYLNVVLKTTKENLEQDSATELRKIKDIIYSNRNNQFWCDWIVTENFVASLQSASDHSSVYGGLDITTTVNYRETQIEEQREQLINILGQNLEVGDSGVKV